MRTLLVLATLLATSSALAQGVETPNEEVRYQRRTVVEFSSMDVEGRRMRPDTGYVHARKKTKFRSMISLRGSFRAEMLASVDDL